MSETVELSELELRYEGYRLRDGHDQRGQASLFWPGNAFSVPDHYATRDGWNRWHAGSVSNQPCVRVAVKESDLCREKKFERHDPFDHGPPAGHTKPAPAAYCRFWHTYSPPDSVLRFDLPSLQSSSGLGIIYLQLLRCKSIGSQSGHAPAPD